MRDDETLARAWAIPGTPGLEHRIGGIEKDYDSGNISYDAENHQKMVDTRAEKIARIANDIPDQAVAHGPTSGKLAILGWGSTFGTINAAAQLATEEGYVVSQIHLRYLNPLPKNLGELLAGFEHVLVPEMNAGQLATMVRDKYLVDAEPMGKITGKPFKVSEMLDAIRARMEI